MTDWSTTSSERGPFALTFGYRDESAYASSVQGLVEARVAGRMGERDHTLWGPAAESEAAKRLAWVGLPDESRGLVAEIEALRDELRAKAVDHVVLCG
ncbi:MAG: hypothetical protein ACRDO7_02280, partial [Nocardioidaceae bacterium]